jgi:hypothetical protein
MVGENQAADVWDCLSQAFSTPVNGHHRQQNSPAISPNHLHPRHVPTPPAFKFWELRSLTGTTWFSSAQVTPSGILEAQKNRM